MLNPATEPADPLEMKENQDAEISKAAGCRDCISVYIPYLPLGTGFRGFCLNGFVLGTIAAWIKLFLKMPKVI